MTLHVDRHLVDAGKVLTLYDGIHVDIAEVCHLLADIVAEVVFGAQHQYLGLYAQSLQLLYAGLCRFGFQLACCSQVGYVGQMDVNGATGTEFPT